MTRAYSSSNIKAGARWGSPILAIGLPLQGRSADEPAPVGDLGEAFVSSIPLINDH